MINNSIPVLQSLPIQEQGGYFTAQTVFIEEKKKKKHCKGENYFNTKVLQWQPGCLMVHTALTGDEFWHFLRGEGQTKLQSSGLPTRLIGLLTESLMKVSFGEPLT